MPESEDALFARMAAKLRAQLSWKRSSITLELADFEAVMTAWDDCRGDLRPSPPRSQEDCNVSVVP